MVAQRPWYFDSVGRYPVPVLESLPVVILIGTLLGFLSGLGIGGGSLLIIWLSTVLHRDPLIARCINLMFFIPSAVVACIIRRKKDQLNLKIALPGIISGCIFALLGYWISTRLDIGLLKKLFGAILIFAGVKELLYRPRKAK